MDVGRDPKPIEPTRSLFILFYLCLSPQIINTVRGAGGQGHGRVRRQAGARAGPPRQAGGAAGVRGGSVAFVCTYVVSPPLLYLCPCVGACIIPTHPPPTLQPNPTQPNTTQITPKNPKQKNHSAGLRGAPEARHRAGQGPQGRHQGRCVRVGCVDVSIVV